ncbi:MAG: acyltransferase [Steroidobacteraceae bacterium]
MLNSWLLRIKTGDGLIPRLGRRIVRGTRTFRLPIPAFLNGLLRFLFEVVGAIASIGRWFLAVVFYEPLFRGRCVRVGKRARITRLPFVVGPVQIALGDDVNFFGKVDVMSGHILAGPRLVLGDRVDIGHNVSFVVNQLIEIGDDVNVASGVRFMDSDAHPRDTIERISDMAPRPEEIKPVKICRRAWIGQNTFILKGVTIGEGAIIGVNSVVVTDIPPYSVAMGNPARVVVKGAAPSNETTTAKSISNSDDTTTTSPPN